MKLYTRKRLRIGVSVGVAALAVAVSGLTMAAADPAAAAARPAATCTGKAQLGPTRYIWAGNSTIGDFYLAWNSCTKVVYTEAEITNRNISVHGYINVYNSSGVSFALGPHAPSLGSDGYEWWDSGFLSIYSNPSTDRNYLGDIEFTDSNGNPICTEGYTPTWNFSGAGVQSQGTDSYC